MMLRAWKRGFAAVLLMTIVLSVAAADRACPTGEASAASEGAQHHGSGASHHGEDVPAPERGMDCHMMLTCGSAVSMQAATLHVISVAMMVTPSIVAPHYTAPHLRQESPPPKSRA
jgi:hypothetical protein